MVVLGWLPPRAREENTNGRVSSGALTRSGRVCLPDVLRLVLEVILSRNDSRIRVGVGGLGGNDERLELLRQLRFLGLGMNEWGKDTKKMHGG